MPEARDEELGREVFGEMRPGVEKGLRREPRQAPLWAPCGKAALASSLGSKRSPSLWLDWLMGPNLSPPPCFPPPSLHLVPAPRPNRCREEKMGLGGPEAGCGRWWGTNRLPLSWSQGSSGQD